MFRIPSTVPLNIDGYMKLEGIEYLPHALNFYISLQPNVDLSLKYTRFTPAGGKDIERDYTI